jgi:hypothetical protein
MDALNIEGRWNELVSPEMLDRMKRRDPKRWAQEHPFIEGNAALQPALEPGIYEVRLRSQTFRVFVLERQSSQESVTGLNFAHHGKLDARWMTLVSPLDQDDAAVWHGRRQHSPLSRIARWSWTE